MPCGYLGNGCCVLLGFEEGFLRFRVLGERLLCQFLLSLEEGCVGEGVASSRFREGFAAWGTWGTVAVSVSPWKHLVGSDSGRGVLGACKDLNLTQATARGSTGEFTPVNPEARCPRRFFRFASGETSRRRLLKATRSGTVRIKASEKAAWHKMCP